MRKLIALVLMSGAALAANAHTVFQPAVSGCPATDLCIAVKTDGSIPSWTMQATGSMFAVSQGYRVAEDYSVDLFSSTQAFPAGLILAASAVKDYGVTQAGLILTSVVDGDTGNRYNLDDCSYTQDFPGFVIANPGTVVTMLISKKGSVYECHVQ